MQSSPASSPRIAIVGRPNVGKSTLFNRLLGRRRALVHDEPGVTRDRLEEKAEWWVRAKRFPVLLVDTGGLGGDKFADEVDAQVALALEQADIALLVFDGQAGLTPDDREILRKLNQSGVMKKIPVLAVVNKVDAESHETFSADFYRSGLDPILTVSAEHGRGIDDLQEAIWLKVGAPVSVAVAADRSESESDSDLNSGLDSDLEAGVDSQEAPYDPGPPRVAIVGRPNVGKSTLVNSLLGEHRMITSPIAGTTIDAVDSIAEVSGKEIILIDTAGIRRKSKTEQGVEVLSVVQARKALERCQVAVLLLDGETGIIDQDEKIGGLIEDVGCAVILCVNKWDTQRSNPEFTREIAAERIRKQMAYLRYAPLMFVSAKTGEGFEDLGDLVEEILSQRRVKIPTREFTDWVRKESEIHNPMGARFYLCHQSGRNPPTFVCHVNDPKKVHFSLKRHLVNAIRDRWGYMGNPVRLLFVQSKNT